jgi:U3 small nucleolar RNA-associated protein 12
MVKTYLKYNLSKTLGQITSNNSNITVSLSNSNYLFSACNDTIICFDLKTSEPLFTLSDQKSKITSLSPSKTFLAVGYENGSIALVDLSSSPTEIDFSNKKFFPHKSAVTSLSFNSSHTLLISGSNDTNIYIHDIISDISLFKLSGHKDNIIKCEFYNENEAYAFSLSRDNCLKIWNINNQICIYSHVDMVHKISTYVQLKSMVLFGSFDEKIKIYQVGDLDSEQHTTGKHSSNSKVFVVKGSLIRQSKAKVIQILNYQNDIISILSSDNSIEIFKVLSQKEVKNRVLLSLLNKDSKNKKREKLIQKDMFTLHQSQCKEIIKSNEYNYSAKFKSLFKFEESNEHNNDNKHKKIFSHVIINHNKFAYASNTNKIDIYSFTTDMLNQNIYSLDKAQYEINELTSSTDNLKIKKSFSISS